MASNKMLIDASHREETRVAVVRGNRVEEFDYESQDKAQIRGNIYLAKVTRVEPSLQAAFVDYGGNRHGFLAFSEIHPDYYQIPHADRQALLDEEAAESRAAAQSEDDYDNARDEGEKKKTPKPRRSRAKPAPTIDENSVAADAQSTDAQSVEAKNSEAVEAENGEAVEAENGEVQNTEAQSTEVASAEAETVEAETVETEAAESEEKPKRRRAPAKKPAAKKPAARKPRAKAASKSDDGVEEPVVVEAASESNSVDGEPEKDTKPAKPKRAARPRKTTAKTKAAAESETAKADEIEAAQGNVETGNTSDTDAGDADAGEVSEGEKPKTKRAPKTMSAVNDEDKISEPAPEEGAAEESGSSAEENSPPAQAEASAQRPRRRTTRRTSRKPKVEEAPVVEQQLETKSVAPPSPSQEVSSDASTGENDASTEAVSANETPAEETPAKKTRTRRTKAKETSVEEAKAVETQPEETRPEETKPAEAEPVETKQEEANGEDKRPATRGRKRGSRRANGKNKPIDNEDNGDEESADVDVESVGQEDALEEVPVRRKSRRQYKIQEVIKRRQVLLVQVVKEERGNKGAALTTYLSLAGRYSVLMPNTARGGGISRKITNAADRKRLKTIASELEVPEGMGIILRTAGATRTKADINRDFDYLMRLWENVRNLTLSSTAPCLVYEEGSLIKRSIRDLYNRDISEVIVSGEEGYKEAKDFMRMLIPSHAKHVKPHRDDQPLFARYGAESQLDKMMSQQVSLKSGGYLVINQTEALVAIDVNSGRSTREHSIEETAKATNLEAAEEVSRQLRLRDLAGLIVIDFIDMEESRNIREVEKRLKESLKTDRARIQVGRISHFGLLEMSRQRMRASVLDSTMNSCPHCDGRGIIRSESGIALHVVRSVEEHLMRHSRFEVIVKCPAQIALQVLNFKRQSLVELEERFGTRILFADNGEHYGQEFTLEKGEPSKGEPKPKAIQIDVMDIDEVDDGSSAWDEDDAAEEANVANSAANNTANNSATGDDYEDNNKPRKRKRRRRSKGGRDGDDRRNGEVDQQEAGSSDGEANEGQLSVANENDDEDGKPRKKRRRGKRAGRRDREQNDEQNNSETYSANGQANSSQTNGQADEAQSNTANEVNAEAPSKTEAKPTEASSDKATNVSSADSSTNGSAAISEGSEAKTGAMASTDGQSSPDGVEEDAKEQRGRNTRRRNIAASNDEVAAANSDAPAPAKKEEKSKKGWWNRRFFS